jgi:hypothetical protein
MAGSGGGAPDGMEWRMPGWIKKTVLYSLPESLQKKFSKTAFFGVFLSNHTRGLATRELGWIRRQLFSYPSYPDCISA